jgi:hypothetical protein
VNLAQQVRFLRPIKLFIRVGVATRLLYADDKRAYFLHALHSRSTLAAEVLVKMKFKLGGRTLEPSTFLACSFVEVPPQCAAGSRRCRQRDPGERSRLRRDLSSNLAVRRYAYCNNLSMTCF